MRVLFVDDDPQLIETNVRTLRRVFDADVEVVASVEDAVAYLYTSPVDLVITDIFIPLGPSPRGALGPRARHYEDTVQHLGGLVLLDEIDRLDLPPQVITHTACTDFALLQILGERVAGRLPKPCPADTLLRAVAQALDLPVLS